MTEQLLEEILRICDEIRAEGETPTVDKVLKKRTGSRRDAHLGLREWFKRRGVERTENGDRVKKTASKYLLAIAEDRDLQISAIRARAEEDVRAANAESTVLSEAIEHERQRTAKLEATLESEQKTLANLRDQLSDLQARNEVAEDLARERSCQISQLELQSAEARKQHQEALISAERLRLQLNAAVEREKRLDADLKDMVVDRDRANKEVADLVGLIKSSGLSVGAAKSPA